MKAIRVGNTRVNLSLVTHVDGRISDRLYKADDGSLREWYERPKPEAIAEYGIFSGLVVTAYFSGYGDYSDYIQFYGGEAETFLALYDLMMDTADSGAIPQPQI